MVKEYFARFVLFIELLSRIEVLKRSSQNGSEDDEFVDCGWIFVIFSENITILSEVFDSEKYTLQNDARRKNITSASFLSMPKLVELAGT